MAKRFMDENFLLSNETATQLFHKHAKDMPIIDYHCHLSPKEIFENKTFNNITEAWLYGDHYKWRVMRANGVEEKFITGDASDYDKFLAWARTVPMIIGNPLYHWTHLELQRFFGVYDLLNEANAPKIWEEVNKQLQGEGFGARDLIVKSNVTTVCTTDDPIDNLEYHTKITGLTGFTASVVPGFRPDKALEINRPTFKPWVAQLSSASGTAIENYGQFLDALESRVRFFHAAGGRVSDHALDAVMFEAATLEEATAIFAKGFSEGSVSESEEKKYKGFTLVFLGKLYSELDWVMQFHIHALRNNNSVMFGRLGPDTGYDSINDGVIAKPLAGLLDALDREDALPKTILYSLNPNDNHVIASLMGSFQGGGVAGKIQFGTAWWYNDNKDGMLEQMNTLANLGVLSQFVGMLTDSRSFLSYTRHEYFRRILCDLVGSWVEAGEAPDDMELLGNMIENICYNNAKQYFNFSQPVLVTN
ncbi:glucuronate isomerase [Paenibacillus sp. 19GGS1-52]|uniref:glucuronate isomerase n=1 Tax=Paenibacillus sp. 19GGS1-52 TaxID=2758563 RepID=UPI001EFBDAC5|nr:glucuronate isomerase [Paenibacillus sp. 19GGS1-52]ULO07430.1 glucuronate isomerase [Paenibacillus sp. 19GGS1-52]